jgi:DNA polymerase I-like protein with 3'-5' exonuclease and polymerase domains
MNLTNAYNLIHEGVLALARAERQGIRVDVEAATKHHQELTVSIKELDTAFKETKGIRR